MDELERWIQNLVDIDNFEKGLRAFEATFEGHEIDLIRDENVYFDCRIRTVQAVRSAASRSNRGPTIYEQIATFVFWIRTLKPIKPQYVLPASLSHNAAMTLNEAFALYYGTTLLEAYHREKNTLDPRTGQPHMLPVKGRIKTLLDMPIKFRYDEWSPMSLAAYFEALDLHAAS